MSISAAQLIATVSIDGAGQAIGDLAAVGNAGDNANATLQKLALGAAIAAGEALVGFGAKAVDMAGNFQASMGKVEAYVNLTKQQTDSLSNSILNLASAMGQSPQAMADALYPIMSAGYDTAQSLDILRLSAETAAASGADMAVVADALTTSLKAMKAPASDAGIYMDIINKMVALGKGQVSDYAAVIGKLALAAGSAKVPFSDMGAALADLTTHGFPSVAQASTALGNLFTQIGPKVDALATHAQKLGLAFDENKFKTMDLADKMAYLEQVTGGNQGELLKLLGGSKVALSAFNALEGSVGDFTGNLKAMAGATGTTGEVFQKTYGNWNNAVDRLNATFQVLMIKVGQQLLPMLTSLVETVTPMVAAFTNWAMSGHAVADMLDWFNHNLQIAIPIVAGLAAMLFATLVPAVWSLAAGVIAATWPILAIGAAVALVAAGAVYLYQNFQFVRDGVAAIGHAFQEAGAFISAGFAPAMQRIGDFFTTTLAPAMQQFGNFVRSQFTPVWQSLVQMWQSKLMPLFAQMWQAMQQLMPVLEAIGIVIGAVVVVAFGILVAIIEGLVQAISGLLTGLIVVLGGIVQMFTGAFQIIGGIIGFFVDLFTGHFDKLGSDLAMIGQGIINLFLGMWNIVAGIFLAAWYTISGYVSGFINGIIGFFTFLWDALVGHSIIPDMVNGILQWFSNMVTQGIQIISSLVSGAVNWFLNLQSQAMSLVMSLVTGVGNYFTTLKNTLNSIVGDTVHQTVGWFQNMYDTIVGHSIVPDLTDGVNSSFDKMSTHVTTTAQRMATNVTSSMDEMKVKAYANVESFSTDTMTMLQKMGDYGSQQMQTMDKNMIGYWNDVAAYISNHPINATVNTGDTTGGVHPGRGNAHAEGTDYAPGGLSLIGERGPEIMYIPRGAQIIPNHQIGRIGGNFAPSGFSPSLPAAAGGAGSGGISSITIPISIGENEIAEYLVDPIMNKVMRITHRKSGKKGL